MTSRAGRRGWNLRIATVKVTARRFSVTFAGHRRPDSTFPDFAAGTGFPERCRGVYRVPQGKMIGVSYFDGKQLIKQLDDWTAEGYKDVPSPRQGRRT